MQQLFGVHAQTGLLKETLRIIYCSFPFAVFFKRLASSIVPFYAFDIILDRVAAQPPRPLSGAKSQRSGLATP